MAPVILEEIPVPSQGPVTVPPVEIAIGPTSVDSGRNPGDAGGKRLGLDLYREGGQDAAGSVVEANVVRAVPFMKPAVPEEIPVPSVPPVEIPIGPNSADSGRLGSNADGKCLGLDLYRERGRGAAGPIVGAIIVEAVPVMAPAIVTGRDPVDPG